MKNLKITLFVSVLIFMFSCEKETATKTTPTINNCFIGLPDTIYNNYNLTVKPCKIIINKYYNWYLNDSLISSGINDTILFIDYCVIKLLDSFNLKMDITNTVTNLKINEISKPVILKHNNLINHVGLWKVTSNLGYNIYAYPSFNLLVDSSKYFHETGNLNFTISNGNCEKSININTNCDGISVSCVFFEPINDTEFYKMTYIDLIVLQDELVKFNSSINPTSFYGIKKDTTILGNTAAVTIKETSGIKL